MPTRDRSLRALPVLLLPKLLDHCSLIVRHDFLVQFSHYGNGDGRGDGDAPNEDQADMHPWKRSMSDLLGSGLGEGEHSWNGSNTFMYHDGEGYAV